MTKNEKGKDVRKRAGEDLRGLESRIRARSAVLRDQRISHHERSRTSELWGKRHKIIAMDVESTGLCQNSYPVEIAITTREKQRSSIQFTTIIQPTAEWLENGEETTESWGVHKIPREALKAGMEPWKVCEILDIMLAGENVYVSGGKWDAYWIARLYEGRTPAFTIRHLDEFPEDQMKNNLDKNEIQHRALPDATALALAIEAITQKTEAKIEKDEK